MDKEKEYRFLKLYEQLASFTQIVNQKPEITQIEGLLNEISSMFRLAKGVTHFYKTPSNEQRGIGETMCSYDIGAEKIKPVHTVRFVTKLLSISTMTVYMAEDEEPLTDEELSAGKGIDFLLNPDFSKVDSNVFLGALGQSFYSLSIAMGCLCTYASYFSRSTNITSSAVQIGLIDTVVAVLAGLMIFPAAFSVGVSPDSGPSLIFITLPNVFNQAFAGMPVVGWIISLLFYALLSLAALTSLISLHEVNTAFFYEELHISRKSGAVIVTVVCCLIGAVCSVSIGQKETLSLFGMNLFDLFDFVTGQIMLPVAGMLMCLFVGWYVPKRVLRDEITNWGTLKCRFFNVYLYAVRIICPLCILAILLHQFGVI